MEKSKEKKKNKTYVSLHYKSERWLEDDWVRNVRNSAPKKTPELRYYLDSTYDEAVPKIYAWIISGPKNTRFVPVFFNLCARRYIKK